MDLPVYVAVFERDPWSPAWNVWVPDCPGVHTFATRLQQAREHVREALALWLDVDETAFEIAEDVRLTVTARLALDEATEATDILTAAQRRAATATITAVHALLDAGLPIRDVADLLHLSHQRVWQLSKQ